MNPTAVKEAICNNYPIGKMVGVRGGPAVRRRCLVAGAAEAKGYKALSFNQTGTDYPIMQDISNT